MRRYEQEPLASCRRHYRTQRHTSSRGRRGGELAQLRLSSTGCTAIADADVHSHADAADRITVRLAIADADGKRKAVTQAERKSSQVAHAVA